MHQNLLLICVGCCFVIVLYSTPPCVAVVYANDSNQLLTLVQNASDFDDPNKLSVKKMTLVQNASEFGTYYPNRLLVKMTVVRNASDFRAYCLDGSLPAYHLDRGFGAGARNWLLQFEFWPSFEDVAAWRPCTDQS